MKKKIVILSLRGGFGHISTSNALYEQLKSDYDVQVVFLFEDMLHDVDFIARLTNDRFSFPKLYNFIIQRRLACLMSAVYFIGTLFFFLIWSSIKNSLQVFFEQQKPDCIISVVPLVNSEIAAYTKKVAIPFILIPTDIDAHFFLRGVAKNVHEKLFICPMIMNKFVQKQLDHYGIEMRYVHHIGAILRGDFFEHKNSMQIKQQYGLPLDKPIILVMMGGMGSKKIVPIARTLAQFSLPIHVVLCTGKDAKAVDELNKIVWRDTVSYTILGFTERISDLMAVSDVLLTKSGTLSVLEGISMHKVLLLDGIGSVLPWERYNHTLIEESGFGYSIKSHAQLEQKLIRLLQNKREYERIQTNLNGIDRKNGTTEIKGLLEKFLL